MIDFIYTTVKPSHSKKLQIMQSIKHLMFQVIVIFSDWILMKQIIISSFPFCCWGKQLFERLLPGRISHLLLPRAWWQELGASLQWGEAWVKMPRVNAFWRNVNSIIFFSHTWWNIKVWEKIQQAFCRER